MTHVAIMDPKLGFLPKILSGRKSVESRWLKGRSAPWGKVSKGDSVYFKDSGKPVTVRAEVSKVLEVADLTPAVAGNLLREYGGRIGLAKGEIEGFYESVKGKRYCVLVFLKGVTPVEPFHISKRGFGTMSAWMSVESVESVKVR